MQGTKQSGYSWRKEVMVSWTKVVVEETEEENMQNQFNGKIDRTSW